MPHETTRIKKTDQIPNLQTSRKKIQKEKLELKKKGNTKEKKLKFIENDKYFIFTGFQPILRKGKSRVN